MADPLFVLDIGTQLDDIYTGIGNVNHQLMKWFRRVAPAETAFVCRGQVVHETAVDEILARRSGRGFGDLLRRGYLSREPLAALLARERDRATAALFSSAKTSRGLFTYEAQVIHDLTVPLMPEFHQPSTIERHGVTLEADLASDDLIVCVSRNTFDDLALYLGIAPERMLVAPLGVDDVDVVARTGDIEPFILVLGTVEPRKNVGLILETLRARPDLLQRWRWVFVGHDGWGETFSTLLGRYGLDHHRGGRILPLGFVPDALRNTLLANADALVYPSFYEGFGLPVIEALHAGCAVITSLSSSLPEVGGPVAAYIDPYSPPALAAALDALPADPEGEVARRAREVRKAWASEFTWDRFCHRVFARMCADLSQPPRPEAVRGTARRRLPEVTR